MALPKAVRKTYYVLYINSGSSLSSEIYGSLDDAERRKKALTGQGYLLSIQKRTRLEIIGS
jgi:hypothetical protein